SALCRLPARLSPRSSLRRHHPHERTLLRLPACNPPLACRPRTTARALDHFGQRRTSRAELARWGCLSAAVRGPGDGRLDSLPFPRLRRVPRRRDLRDNGKGVGGGRGLPADVSPRRTPADEVSTAVPGAAGWPVEAVARLPRQPDVAQGAIARVRSGGA